MPKEQSSIEPIKVKLFTIGFTKTTAEHFFLRLKSAGVDSVTDVRLKNTSQLSGFARSQDLAYFLKNLAGIDYRHEPLLAPTGDNLSAYKKKKMPWDDFERQFLDLIAARRVEEKYSPDFFERSCLLSSEDTPHFCHRRLIVEYLNHYWPTPIHVKHL